MPTTTIGWFSFIFGIIGAICIATYTYPSFFKLLKTKDSSGISLIMFAILSVGSTAFLLNGILGMVDAPKSIPTLIGVTVANLFSGISGWVCVSIRIHQGRMAKKEGICVAEYCKRHHPQQAQQPVEQKPQDQQGY